MQYHAIPCNTMQYHWTLITADGAYHCPVGSIMAIFFRQPQLELKFVATVVTSGYVKCLKTRVFLHNMWKRIQLNHSFYQAKASLRPARLARPGWLHHGAKRSFLGCSQRRVLCLRRLPRIRCLMGGPNWSSWGSDYFFVSQGGPTDPLEEAKIFVPLGGPKLTFLRKWRFLLFKFYSSTGDMDR